MRVRFAPSPTGYLHVGGARTALFNFLLARKNGGTFVLRVEDTDQDRNKEEHVEAILDGMAWLGMKPDEGPYFQSDGFERHRGQAESMLFAGAAYPLFADDFKEGEARPARPEQRDRSLLLESTVQSPERTALVQRMRSEPYAIVCRVPDEGAARWNDLVHGEMVFQWKDIEDFLLVRSDGVPLYNMACASDDHEHKIDVVLRGDDHIANTPKQILIYLAYGWKVPTFGHLPMILGPDGQRLSKRHGATSVQQYAQGGILPEALTNFLALLGWNPGDEEEIMSLERLIERFSVERVQKKAAVFDTTKLAWMNGEYFKNLPPNEVADALVQQAPEDRSISLHQRRDWANHLIAQFQPRSATLGELLEKIGPFFEDSVIVYDPPTLNKHWAKDPEKAAEILSAVRNGFHVADWTPETIEARLRRVAEEIGVGFGKVVHSLRLALTGIPHGCGIDWTVYLLGWELVRRRIDAALAHLATMEARDGATV